MNLTVQRVVSVAIGIMSIMALCLVSLFFFGAESLASTSDTIQQGVNSIDGESDGTSLERIIELIINAILFLVGIVSVVMIILGGFRYVISNGDSSQMKAAKDTILYAIVGLVVAIAAYAIINFVLAIF